MFSGVDLMYERLSIKQETPTMEEFISHIGKADRATSLTKNRFTFLKRAWETSQQ